MSFGALDFFRLAVKRPKLCRKTAENLCWKTAETRLLENGRNIWGCRKTAEISAVFKQSEHVVGKWQKFRPFSYNPLKRGTGTVGKRPKQCPNHSRRKIVGKRPKFRPFSNNHSSLLENDRNHTKICRVETLLENGRNHTLPIENQPHHCVHCVPT